MSAHAKEAIREALALAATMHQRAQYDAHDMDWARACDGTIRAALASLDSLVMLTAEEAEKVRREIKQPAIVMPSGTPCSCDGCSRRREALALLSGSGRDDNEENE